MKYRTQIIPKRGRFETAFKYNPETGSVTVTLDDTQTGMRQTACFQRCPNSMRPDEHPARRAHDWTEQRATALREMEADAVPPDDRHLDLPI